MSEQYPSMRRLVVPAVRYGIGPRAAGPLAAVVPVCCIMLRRPLLYLRERERHLCFDF